MLRLPKSECLTRKEAYTGLSFTDWRWNWTRKPISCDMKKLWISDILFVFLVRGDEYDFWGLWRSDLHLFGVEAPGKLFLFGTDRMGRDMFSRCFYGSRISLSIGMFGVFVSLLLGVTLGGISGYRGGWADGVIQRDNRNNKMFSEHTSLDGAFSGNASPLARTESIFRYYHHSVAYWMDGPCENGARQIDSLARGGIRSRSKICRSGTCTDHISPFAAFFHQPHNSDCYIGDSRA